MDDALKRAKKKYKPKVKRFTVDFYPTETDLIEHLAKQPKKQTYIKDLIRADMQSKCEMKMIEIMAEAERQNLIKATKNALDDFQKTKDKFKVKKTRAPE